MNRLILIFPIWLLIACTIDQLEQGPSMAKGKPPKDTILDIDLIEAEGHIEVKITASDAVLPPTGKISFQVVSKEVPEVYYWYIDGREINNNTEKLKLNGRDVPDGHHRIDCIVEISDRLGGDTVYFERN